MNSIPIVPCLALFIALIVTGCVSSPPEEKNSWTIPPDKYVFIDHHVSRNGVVVSGTCSGGMMIDFPMYSFNRETKELSGMSTQEIAVNDSLKIVYGDGMSLGGAVGGGAATHLTPVYALPFAQGAVVISSVTSEGVAGITVANKTITLPPGETWTDVTVTTGPEDYPGNGNCIIRITRTETLFNGGIIDKGLIQQA